jgi:hypothetical protein
MADINNTAPLIFAQGGTVSIGGDNVVNLVPGSLRLTPGMITAVEWNHLGVAQIPRAGTTQYTSIEFQAYMAKYAASGLFDKSNDVEAASNAIKTFNVIIDQPDLLGAATGTRHTISNCYFVPGGCSFEAAAGEGPGDLNIATIRLMSSSQPTYATY